MEKSLLSVAEAAEVVGVSRSFLYDRVMAGEVASLKIGKLRKIRVADLEQWIESLAMKELA